MTFEEVLTSIAQSFGLDAYDLIGYSYEDEITGWDSGYGDWPVGSLWTVEGRILYALIRALQPDVVVEIGTNVGCSASHMASALKENGKGKLLSFDTEKAIVIPPDKAGHSAVYAQGELIPEALRPYVEVVNEDGIAFLNDKIGDVDFVFEDGAHSLQSTRDAWLAGVKKLNPGGIMISHDAAHFLVGQAIQDGIREAEVTPTVYEVAPSDCGLAIWRKPLEAEEPQPAQVKVGKDIPLSAFIPKGDAEDTFKTDFQAMTDDELREYADDQGIDLGRLRKRESIIERLQEAI
jgi:predicted O-methyltransferase YrrM